MVGIPLPLCYRAEMEIRWRAFCLCAVFPAAGSSVWSELAPPDDPPQSVQYAPLPLLINPAGGVSPAYGDLTLVQPSVYGTVKPASTYESTEGAIDAPVKPTAPKPLPRPPKRTEGTRPDRASAPTRSAQWEQAHQKIRLVQCQAALEEGMRRVRAQELNLVQMRLNSARSGSLTTQIRNEQDAAKTRLRAQFEAQGRSPAFIERKLQRLDRSYDRQVSSVGKTVQQGEKTERQLKAEVAARETRAMMCKEHAAKLTTWNDNGRKEKKPQRPKLPRPR